MQYYFVADIGKTAVVLVLAIFGNAGCVCGSYSCVEKLLTWIDATRSYRCVGMVFTWINTARTMLLYASVFATITTMGIQAEE